MKITVRCVHLDNSEHVDQHAREKVAASLANFSHRIEHVDLLLEDLHGPKHGTERRCVIRVAILGAPEAKVQHLDPDIYHAIDEAAKRTKRAVRRRINRRRAVAHQRAVGARHAA